MAPAELEGIKSISVWAVPAFVVAVLIVDPVGFTLSSSVSMFPISVSSTPSYRSRVLIPMKKNCPSAVAFPWIISSSTMAVAHAKASTLL